MSKHSFLLMALLAAAAMLLGTAWICDDAFITLRVIDNFVNGHGLRYNVIERVQVFTHPLWLIFLTPLYALTREPMLTPMLFSVILSLLAFWLLATRIAKTIEYGSLLILLAAASRAICDFSTSGLETPLTYLLLALFVWQLYRQEKTWISAGIAGLLLLNRLDLVILVGPAVAYLLFCARGGSRIKIALAVSLPALTWIAISVVYYGVPFPNTAYAKLGTGFGAVELIARGVEYAKDFVFTDTLLALVIGKAVFDALRSRNGLTTALGIGVLLYVVYITSIGGDFMSGRFFAAPGFLALCIFAQLPAPQWLAKQWKLMGLIGIGILGITLVARIMEPPMNTLMISGNGISDERRFYYADTGLVPVLSKWLATGVKPVPQAGRRGQELQSMGQGAAAPLVVAAQAIGMRGYYGGSNVHILDEVALADAFLARLPAAPDSRVGHYRRILPPGYAETVGYASPTTDIEVLRPLLNDVNLATRAPLSAEGRWDAIWRLSSGHYRWIYETDIYGARK